MYILIDSREQKPFTFSHEKYNVQTEIGTLDTGDYSLLGLTNKVAIERKSLPDLVMCLGRERERFERELQRATGLDFFAVVVEASWQDLILGNYRSKLSPHSACQSVMAFMNRYKTTFMFAGTVLQAEYCTWSFLRQYIENQRKFIKAISKHVEIK